MPWGTLYGADSVFLHLSNNDLVQIPYNQTLSTDTPITTLASPPAGSRLVLTGAFQNPVIYAIEGQTISYYDPVGDTWRDSNAQGADFCPDTAAFSPASLQGVLFYGGSCNNNRQLYLYNTTAKAIQKMDSSVHPLGFSGAASANVDFSTTVFIGGNTSSDVWVGMNQVAYYQGGWNYRNVQNSQMLDSRSGALLLPIFPASFSLDESSVAPRALILGGIVDGRSADPFTAVLEFSQEGWVYDSNSSFDAQQGILGAATLFETLLTIGGNEKSNEKSKRDGLYSVQLFNVNNLEKVQSYVPSQAPLPGVASSTSSSGTSTTITQAMPSSTTAGTSATITPAPADTKKSSSMSAGGIAALSTILPIAAIVAALAFWWYKKKKSNTVHLPRERLDYFEDFMPPNRPEMSDANSLNSWTEKRRMYDLDHHHDNRNSILTHVDNRNSILSQADIPCPPPARMASVKSAYSLDDRDVQDVQVLVSSRRRTQLRVANPDDDLIDL